MLKVLSLHVMEYIYVVLSVSLIYLYLGGGSIRHYCQMPIVTAIINVPSVSVE